MSNKLLTFYKLSLSNRYWLGHENFINEDYDADDLLIQLDYHDETRKRLIKRNKKGMHKLSVIKLRDILGRIQDESRVFQDMLHTICLC